jgi:transposase
MSNAFKTLPDDIESLKALVLEQAERTAQLRANNDQLTADNARYQARVITLTEQLHLALARQYAARSEKLSADQLPMFDEAEADSAEVPGDETGDTDDQSIEIAAHTRSKRGRKPLPEDLPRVEVVYDLAEAERICPHDGRALKAIGEAVSEQLDIVPAKIQVIRHIRRKYACDCGQCIKTAPLAPQPIPKSLASPGLLAHIAVSKYQDALPLYRQEQILQRIGVDIPRATLSNWMIRAGELIQPLVNLLRDTLLGYDIVQMDETPVQVLKEPGKAAQSKSYLWVQRGGPPDRPVILYDYDPSRSGAVPQRLLAGYVGYLQTDGYEGYKAVVQGNGLVSVGCLAHARRRFADAVKAQGKGKPKKAGIAQHALGLIQKLYRVEKQARDFTPEDRKTYRDAHATPVIDKLRAWLDEHLPAVPPQTATGKALYYLNDQWPRLTRYLDDGRLEIDNNRTENAIRPFVVGRKNWLFSDSVKGVTASANLYSLIESAKANGLEPYAYLREVFTRLPAAGTVEDIEALLPFKIARERKRD